MFFAPCILISLQYTNQRSEQCSKLKFNFFSYVFRISSAHPQGDSRTCNVVCFTCICVSILVDRTVFKTRLHSHCNIPHCVYNCLVDRTVFKTRLHSHCNIPHCVYNCLVDRTVLKTRLHSHCNIPHCVYNCHPEDETTRFETCRRKQILNIN